jgi:hypothetical protein
VFQALHKWTDDYNLLKVIKATLSALVERFDCPHPVFLFMLSSVGSAQVRTVHARRLRVGSIGYVLTSFTMFWSWVAFEMMFFYVFQALHKWTDDYNL